MHPAQQLGCPALQGCASRSSEVHIVKSPTVGLNTPFTDQIHLSTDVCCRLIHVDMCTGTYTHMCVCALVSVCQILVSGVSLDCSLPYILRQGLSLEHRAYLFHLSSWPSCFEDLMPQPPECWGYV